MRLNKAYGGKRSGMEAFEVVLVVALLFLVFLVGYYIGTTTIPQTTPTSPTQLAVAGKFSTVNFGTSGSSIQFKSDATGTVYFGNASNGQYSVTLPNQDAYSVKIHWSDVLGIRSGDCTAGNLVLRVEVSGGGPINADWSC